MSAQPHLGPATCGFKLAWFVRLALVYALVHTANAQIALPKALTLSATNVARSASGQFIVEAIVPLRAAPPTGLANNPNYLSLEPPLTAIYCERIKRALLDTLDDNSPWRDRIYLRLRPAQSADDGAAIVSEHFQDGWKYRVELPNLIERARFVRAVVQTLLLEMAGRTPSDHSPEIPAWLAEGLSQQLLRSDEGDLLPRPPHLSVNGLTLTPTVMNGRRHDPLAAAHRVLSEQPPLTISELSWPTDERAGGPTREAYSCSAQLLVSELLRFKDGPVCLRAMLGELAHCYNWQTAFFRAFHRHFERQLDLEKWWALQVVQFTGRNLTQTWSPEESWNKLDEILHVPVDVRLTRNEMPGRAEASLATIIRDWDFIRQDRTLRSKLRELELLRLRVSQKLVSLVDDYRRLLAKYLEGRDHAGLILPGSKMPSAGANFVVRETLKQLATLEARREALRPPSASVSSASTEAPAPAAP
jgi:hypothetical protein